MATATTGHPVLGAVVDREAIPPRARRVRARGAATGPGRPPRGRGTRAGDGAPWSRPSGRSTGHRRTGSRAGRWTAATSGPVALTFDPEDLEDHNNHLRGRSDRAIRSLPRSAGPASSSTMRSSSWSPIWHRGAGGADGDPARTRGRPPGQALPPDLAVAVPDHRRARRSCRRRCAGSSSWSSRPGRWSRTSASRSRAGRRCSSTAGRAGWSPPRTRSLPPCGACGRSPVPGPGRPLPRRTARSAGPEAAAPTSVTRSRRRRGAGAPGGLAMTAVSEMNRGPAATGHRRPSGPPRRRPTHYCCPGCGHGVVHRLVADLLGELGVAERTIAIAPVGCSVFAYDYIDVDWVRSPHGRAPAVATGVRRVRPDAFVLMYQGDGDLAAIGTAEIVHAAARGERITAIFVNNGIYGMTGGQMAPTSLLGQKTTSSPDRARCTRRRLPGPDHRDAGSPATALPTPPGGPSPTPGQSPGRSGP